MPLFNSIIKFISEHGWITYSTAHEERTRREINAKFTIDKADVQAYCADAKADIDQHHTAAVSHIDNYAPMECLTQAEYEAKQQAGTLEEDKLYYRFPNS